MWTHQYSRSFLEEISGSSSFSSLYKNKEKISRVRLTTITVKDKNLIVYLKIVEAFCPIIWLLHWSGFLTTVYIIGKDSERSKKMQLSEKSLKKKQLWLMLLTIGSNLSSSSISCHACLAGSFVGTILETNNWLSCF